MERIPIDEQVRRCGSRNRPGPVRSICRAAVPASLAERLQHLAVATLLALWLGSGAALGDVEDGRQIAARWCGGCHVTGALRRAPGSDAAPSFAAIAAMPSATEMSLRVFLQTPHQRMPDLHLSRQETDDLIAYILSHRAR